MRIGIPLIGAVRSDEKISRAGYETSLNVQRYLFLVAAVDEPNLSSMFVETWIAKNVRTGSIAPCLSSQIRFGLDTLRERILKPLSVSMRS